MGARSSGKLSRQRARPGDPLREHSDLSLWLPDRVRGADVSGPVHPRQGSGFFFFFFFFFLSFVVVVVAISWAAPAAYGGSQARG